MKVYFIVKPIGNFRLKQLRKSLEKTFDNKKDSFHIFSSMKKGHTITLTEKAIEQKADVVVACGGDGTVNEVARGLVETEISFGIIPLGSGNGIARHFNIPFEISKSAQIIKKNKLAKMDVGVINGHYFFGNMGCALESHFIRNYQKNGRHGIWAYIVAFFDALLNFKHQKIQIEYQGKIRQISPYILLLSNTNQQGYDFSLTPQALTDDGQMDLFAIGIEDTPPAPSYQTIEDLKTNYTLVKSSKQRTALLGQLLQQQSVCFDTETTSLNPLKADIIGMSFSYQKNEYR